MVKLTSAIEDEFKSSLKLNNIPFPTGNKKWIIGFFKDQSKPKTISMNSKGGRFNSKQEPVNNFVYNLQNSRHQIAELMILFTVITKNIFSIFNGRTRKKDLSYHIAASLLSIRY